MPAGGERLRVPGSGRGAVHAVRQVPALLSHQGGAASREQLQARFSAQGHFIGTRFHPPPLISPLWEMPL